MTGKTESAPPMAVVVHKFLVSKSASVKDLMPFETEHERERFIKCVAAYVIRNEKLVKCTQPSLLASMVEAAQLGLEPGVTNQCWFVPYNNKYKDDTGQWRQRLESEMQIGYGGMIKLSKRSGDVASVMAEVVREKDHFRRTAHGLEHEWNPWDDERGKILGVYAIVTLNNGEKQYETMSRKQVDGIRDRARAKKGPWVTDYEEMARKTVLRRALKKVDLDPKAAQAITRDDERSGVVVETQRVESDAVFELLEDGGGDAVDEPTDPEDHESGSEGSGDMFDSVKEVT